MRKFITLMLCFVLVFTFTGCSSTSQSDEDKVQIVTTIFPLYDFARQVGGDKVQVTLLLPTGAEVHSYEPTPKDIITIQESDIFLKLGDEIWASSVINDADKLNVLTAMEFVTLMMEEDHKHTMYSSIIESDPHIWTSPKNAQIISQSICDKLCEIDEKNAGYYKENTKKYIDELSALHEKFTAFTEENSITMVFADQFPFRYFADAYGINYFAAFSGCSSDSEPDAATVTELIDMVKEGNIPVVFYTETSDGKLADTICDETGAKKQLLHSCHSVTDDEIKNGVTYIDLMEKNYLALQKAI